MISQLQLHERNPRSDEPKDKLPALVTIATDRVNRGLAPPAEIYQVRNRARINWSDFPEWARPVDPEAFEGCCHEG
jgi:hypothetical protein